SAAADSARGRSPTAVSATREARWWPASSYSSSSSRSSSSSAAVWPAWSTNAEPPRRGSPRRGRGRSDPAVHSFPHTTQRTHQGRTMKTKRIAVAASATLLLSGCGLVGGGTDSVGEQDGDITKLNVGVSPVPHG